jgi:lipid-binding SYLF domain-containing protein
VFTTYGLSFIVGGAGGKGIAHDNKSGKDTFMDMAQASVGVQLGASQNETLIVFNTPAALKNFVDKGWEYGGGATAAAGGGGKTAGSGSGENVISDASYYTYTKNGFEAGGALQGTKFWKSGDLN